MGNILGLNNVENFSLVVELVLRNFLDNYGNKPYKIASLLSTLSHTTSRATLCYLDKEIPNMPLTNINNVLTYGGTVDFICYSNGIHQVLAQMVNLSNEMKRDFIQSVIHLVFEFGSLRTFRNLVSHLNSTKYEGLTFCNVKVVALVINRDPNIAKEIIRYLVTSFKLTPDILLIIAPFFDKGILELYLKNNLIGITEFRILVKLLLHHKIFESIIKNQEKLDKNWLKELEGDFLFDIIIGYNHVEYLPRAKIFLDIKAIETILAYYDVENIDTPLSFRNILVKQLSTLNFEWLIENSPEELQTKLCSNFLQTYFEQECKSCGTCNYCFVIQFLCDCKNESVLSAHSHKLDNSTFESICTVSGWSPEFQLFIIRKLYEINPSMKEEYLGLLILLHQEEEILEMLPRITRKDYNLILNALRTSDLWTECFKKRLFNSFVHAFPGAINSELVISELSELGLYSLIIEFIQLVDDEYIGILVGTMCYLSKEDLHNLRDLVEVLSLSQMNVIETYREKLFELGIILPEKDITHETNISDDDSSSLLYQWEDDDDQCELSF